MLGLGGTPEREQAERTILRDRASDVGTIGRGAQAVEHGQRVFVGGGRIELTRRGQRIVPARGDRRRQDDQHAERESPPPQSLSGHFFLMSTLSRAGAVAVTVIA